MDQPLKRKHSTFRESAIFNKRYTSVLGAEKSSMLREMYRKKDAQSRERITTPIYNNNDKTSFFKLFGHADSKNHLAPDKLNKTTYFEIFRSMKKSLK